MANYHSLVKVINRVWQLKDQSLEGGKKIWLAGLRVVCSFALKERNYVSCRLIVVNFSVTVLSLVLQEAARPSKRCFPQLGSASALPSGRVPLSWRALREHMAGSVPVWPAASSSEHLRYVGFHRALRSRHCKGPDVQARRLWPGEVVSFTRCIAWVHVQHFDCVQWVKAEFDTALSQKGQARLRNNAFSSFCSSINLAGKTRP